LIRRSIAFAARQDAARVEQGGTGKGCTTKADEGVMRRPDDTRIVVAVLIALFTVLLLTL
jgi:hypothetical protein